MKLHSMVSITALLWALSPSSASAQSTPSAAAPSPPPDPPAAPAFPAGVVAPLSGSPDETPPPTSPDARGESASPSTDLPPAAAAKPALSKGATPAISVAPFMQNYISYQLYTGQASVGKARVPISTSELYAMVGRPDLVALVDRRKRERTAWYVAGGLTAAATVIAGLVVFAMTPEMNVCMGPYGDDVKRLNEVCVVENRRAQYIGSTLVVGGVALGGLVATLGSMVNVDVLSRPQIAGMIAAYNGSLMQRLRSTGVAGPTPKPATSRVSLTPVVSSTGAGLRGQWTF